MTAKLLVLKIRHMKLSVEAKVAAAIAVAFALLSICAIAQQQSEHGTAALNQITLPASAVSLSGHNGSVENQLLAQY